MAEDGSRVIIITPESSTRAKESAGRTTSATTSKPDSCKGKKRALTTEVQDGIGSTSTKVGIRSKGKEIIKTSTVSDNNSDHDHEAHIQTERDRRKRMRDLFSCLQTFHSHLPPKIDKATIVEETVNYIKNLESTLETLQKRKLDQIRNAFFTHQKPSSAASSSVISPAEHPISREAFLADQAGKAPSPLDMPVPLLPLGQQCNYDIQTWSSPNAVLSIVGVDAYVILSIPKRAGVITATAYFLERHGCEALSVQAYSDPNHTKFIMFARANEGGSSSSGTLMAPDERFKLALGEMLLWLGSSN